MQQEQKELLQALYEEYESGLRWMAFKRNIPECEVDDMVQETFWKFMDAYKEKALNWDITERKAKLVNILRNCCHDYHRRLKRKGTISTDSESYQTEYGIMKDQMAGDISDNLIADETAARIRQYIDAMKPEWKEVATMFMIEKRPLTEVCEILDISNAACRMRISRIRKYLRERLGD